MEITKEISVKITPEELKQIVIDLLKKQRGLEISEVNFVIGAHEDPSDWRAEYPLSHKLDEIICTGTEEPKKKKTCTHCGGSGDVRTESRGMLGYDPCPYCNGTGEK